MTLGMLEDQYNGEGQERQSKETIRMGEQPMPDDGQLKRFTQDEDGDLHLQGHIDRSKYSAQGPGMFSEATLTDDGKIDVWVDLKNSLPDLHKDYARRIQETGIESPSEKRTIPPLSIVIFIVGSRGDVQPYLSLALHLVKSHGHRVRIATHPDFKEFVLGANRRLEGVKGPDGRDVEGSIEFFDVGGNPKELMSYMVKNPGLLPGWASLTNGDVHAKRKMTWKMLQGFFLSVFSPDTETGRPFAADAIISNPPAFAHCHVAEAFGLPLHMTFTMPWTPSTAFAHPLVNIRSSNAQAGLTNVLSFSFADLMTWQGLGDIINAFRGMTLGLEPLSIRMGASVLERIRAPWTYCWSDTLIPKPEDWKEHIGFYFLEGDADFKPDAKLGHFLSSGDPPLYIGFGSVVVEDPAAMTQTLFEAVKESGVRALISAGWGGLGGTDIPDNVFILEGNIPHDWLFAEGRVSAVCHHGGAGTTAIGLRNGLPTIVVPFFGDQLFWGEMIHRAGAGPEPIPHNQLSVQSLSAAIQFATSEEAKHAAEKMGEKIRAERGEEKGTESFHRHLPLQSMRCDLQPDKAAWWWHPGQFLRLSGGAAAVLQEEELLQSKDLECLRAKEYQPRFKTNDPTEGGAVDLLIAVLSRYSTLAAVFTAPKEGTAAFAATMPQGVVDLVYGFHLAADAIPAKLGSDVREKGKVDGFVSGVKEGGKGLFYGWWDGITGLVTEPVKGGQREGPIGVLKGMGRSYVNVTARPMAGITGVIALPLHGAYQTFLKKVAGQPHQLIREPRERLSEMEADSLTQQEKEEIKYLFLEAQGKVDERRGWYKRQAEIFLLDMDKRRKENEGEEEGGDGAIRDEEARDVDQGQPSGQREPYIQHGDLRMLTDEERDKMEESERRGYEAAKKAEK